MTDPRQAMQMALEALEQLQGGCTDSDDGTVEAITVWCPEVIDALRAALSAQQEPVANEINRLRDLNRQLVGKANSYVIHNARLDEENKRLRTELSRANNSFGSETADWPGLAERIEDLKARLRVATPTVQPLTAFTAAQRRRLYNNSPEIHSDCKSLAAFERVLILVESAHGIGG